MQENVEMFSIRAIRKTWSNSIYIVQEFCSNSKIQPAAQEKWSVVSVSRLHLNMRSTLPLKPSLNSYSFNWLKFTLRCISSLRPFVSCIAKIEFSLGLIKLRVIFSKFIYQYYVSNFFNKGATFLNRVWIKRQNKSFGSSGKSLHLFFDMMALFSTLHHYSDLNMTEGMTSRVQFMEKSLTKPF